MEQLRLKAMSLGADEFGKSSTKSKRFYVLYDGKLINFGAKNASTFIDHKDPKKQKAWLARHSKIINKNGLYVMRLKSSPSFWSHNILWD